MSTECKLVGAMFVSVLLLIMLMVAAYDGDCTVLYALNQYG